MNIRFHSSVLIVKDITTMKVFYSEALDLKIKDDFGACIGFDCGLSIWQMSDSQPLAKTIDRTYSNAGNKNLEICFETENFNETVKHLKDFGVKLIHDVQIEPWGQKTIRFYDPEKNMLELGESIQAFVERLHSEGLDAVKVSEKTGLPLKQIRKILE